MSGDKTMQGARRLGRIMVPRENCWQRWQTSTRTDVRSSWTLPRMLRNIWTTRGVWLGNATQVTQHKLERRGLKESPKPICIKLKVFFFFVYDFLKKGHTPLTYQYSLKRWKWVKKPYTMELGVGRLGNSIFKKRETANWICIKLWEVANVTCQWKDKHWNALIGLRKHNTKHLVKV